jgi:hypothetical protein
MFPDKAIFLRLGVVSRTPTSLLDDHPLSVVCGCLFNVFAATLHSWKPSLHPQPEDDPCCGDKGPTDMDVKD